ncbi:MAG: hypothetical protein IKR85_11050 [Clostridia bacterium]|nr:hypothetical protein [Clostridia bacterium]
MPENKKPAREAAAPKKKKKKKSGIKRLFSRARKRLVPKKQTKHANAAYSGARRKPKSKKKGRLARWAKRFWGGFTWFYRWTNDPEERESRLKVRLFGRTVTYAGFMIMLLLFIVFITAILNNRAVGVINENAVITGLAGELEGYGILVISDLNGRSFGEKQSTLMRRLESEKYNCIIFLGDMVGPSGDTEPFYTLIEQLNPRKNKLVYFIAGDSDPSPLLETPRDISDQDMTLRQMVLSDWVLGAEELGAVYVDSPQKITRNGAVIWLVPDTYLNLNVKQAAEVFKDELAQQQDSFLAGVERSKDTLPLTNYRYNQLSKTEDIIYNMSGSEMIIMLSHEVPSDSQLLIAQEAVSDKNAYFAAPDLVLSGHYCGGEWKLPLIGTLYVSSNILPRYGWFPDESYVQGQRSVGGTIVYTTQGLGNNSETILTGRLGNPPRVSIIRLTGELPASFLE